MDGKREGGGEKGWRAADSIRLEEREWKGATHLMRLEKKKEDRWEGRAAHLMRLEGKKGNGKERRI